LYGAHQAGVGTPRQAALQLLSFDLTSSAGATAIRTLMRRWSVLAADVTAGKTPSPTSGVRNAMITTGLGAANLTVTVSVGAGLVARVGTVPRTLQPLPAFSTDRLDATRSGGDLMVQLCADDPVVVFAAARFFAQAAEGIAAVRWQQSGFFRTVAAAQNPAGTARNLMGQLDGTDDIVPVAAQSGGPIWVEDDAPAWLRGGSYLVYRRIVMLLDDWESVSLTEQGRVIGRDKVTGAALGATTGTSAPAGEHDPVDLSARDAHGALAIPADAHIRLAAPETNQGAQLHRRVYNFADGASGYGTPAQDSGLVFLAFQADPATGFTPVARRLAKADALNRFIRHTASGLFAVLPGLSGADDWYGRELLRVSQG
jgi:dye decolorizing peroxidase